MVVLEDLQENGAINDLLRCAFCCSNSLSSDNGEAICEERRRYCINNHVTFTVGHVTQRERRRCWFVVKDRDTEERFRSAYVSSNSFMQKHTNDNSLRANTHHNHWRFVLELLVPHSNSPFVIDYEKLSHKNITRADADIYLLSSPYSHRSCPINVHVVALKHYAASADVR